MATRRPPTVVLTEAERGLVRVIGARSLQPARGWPCEHAACGQSLPERETVSLPTLTPDGATAS
jgi:hypothetical protein